MEDRHEKRVSNRVRAVAVRGQSGRSWYPMVNTDGHDERVGPAYGTLIEAMQRANREAMRAAGIYQPTDDMHGV